MVTNIYQGQTCIVGIIIGLIKGKAKAKGCICDLVHLFRAFHQPRILKVGRVAPYLFGACLGQLIADAPKAKEPSDFESGSPAMKSIGHNDTESAPI